MTAWLAPFVTVALRALTSATLIAPPDSETLPWKSLPGRARVMSPVPVLTVVDAGDEGVAALRDGVVARRHAQAGYRAAAGADRAELQRDAVDQRHRARSRRAHGPASSFAGAVRLTVAVPAATVVAPATNARRSG
jgi:hypothetical protein